MIESIQFPEKRAGNSLKASLIDEHGNASMVGIADDAQLSDRSLEEAAPPLLSYNDKCEDHPTELIVAYHQVTLLHLCSQCINQQNLVKEQYYVYPQVV